MFPCSLGYFALASLVPQNPWETLDNQRFLIGRSFPALIFNREKHERPRDPVHIDVIREVAQAVSIPVIANGVSTLVKGYDDIEKYRVETGCSSVMLARAAQWNPSIFR